MRHFSPFAALFLALAIAIAASAQTPPPDGGVLPVGADGKPLNLDFETGTLKDWTAEGKAFDGQPIKGDTVAPRRSDSKSQHQGQYWIGTYEKLGDKPQGTLTSAPFKITHPWASFLVGGGPWMETCVELVLKEKNEVFFRASGMEEENLRRVVVDLQPHKGKEMFIRIVDKHAGHWGHVNFDDFRFHDKKPNFPPRPGAVSDAFKHNGLPPQKAAQAMTVPEGFDVTLFAGEPDVMQPIALALDDRGRVWVAEAYSYPIRRKDKDAKDRIVIFEDTKGTGKFDKRTVFMEGLNLVSGLEVGFGGVWIGAAPYLIYVPMKEERSPHAPREGKPHAEREEYITKPAGKPQILLDGWGYQDTHETLNSFIWGPDGWLYGCHGVFTHSKVGKPGTPDKERVPLNAGVWRYHPTRHKFEVFAHGTSNPWGLDFNDYGQAFVSSTSSSTTLLPHHSGRPLSSPGRQPLQSAHLRRHQDDRRSPALAGGQSVGGQQQIRHERRRPRPLRADVLSRRRLAPGISRPALHGQHPRPTHQHGHAQAQGLRLRRLARQGPALGERFVGPLHQHALRPRRQRLRHRLVRQASLPHAQRRCLGPHQRPHLQDQPSRLEAGGWHRFAEEDGFGAGGVSTARERLVRSACAADFAGAVE